MQIELLSDDVKSFIKTLLWCSFDEELGDLDDYGIEDFSEPTLEKIKKDVESFYEIISTRKIGDEIFYEIISDAGVSDFRIYHDFCLTRNHHGAGFWDGGYKFGEIDLGDQLTKISHK